MKQIESKILNRIKRNLKESGEITPYNVLKLKLLENAIIDYNKAVQKINENGIVIVTNRGATTAQNPAVKIKLDNSKLIIKLIQDLIDKDNTDTDDFLKSLTM